MKRVGVLAIQGDIAAHRRALERIGVQVFPVLTEKDLDGLDALVLPGGESTTISKGLERLGLYKPLRERHKAGMPILGTCAGAILLARKVRNGAVRPLGVIDAIAERNAYGSQIDSFIATVDLGAIAGLEEMRCVFIRAPQFRELGSGVSVLARVNEKPVLVRHNNALATTFHPELSDDSRVHRLLLELTGDAENS